MRDETSLGIEIARTELKEVDPPKDVQETGGLHGCMRLTTGTRHAWRLRERCSNEAASAVGDFLSDAELTAKIKSKMALDDSVRARTIVLSTTDGVVTIAGTVSSVAEHDQAVRLARDTRGVKQVVDHLKVALP